jgi:hypothetical protein
MGSASHLPARAFAPFFESLRATGFQGKTCVFVSRLTAPDREDVGALVDELVDIDDGYPHSAPSAVTGALKRFKRTRGLRKHYRTACHFSERCLRTAAGSEQAHYLEFQLEGLQSLRYRHYLEYLRASPQYDQVMIADLRDVLFQADPFATDVQGLEVFLEDDTETFARPGFNRSWIIDLYGIDAVENMQDLVASCSGVTFGDRAHMLDYLAKMSVEVDRHLPPLGPHDQAVHNWLLYNRSFADAQIVRNGSGRVLTMGLKRDITRSGAGVVMNDDDSTPAVLHQYDRHPALARELLSRT